MDYSGMAENQAESSTYKPYAKTIRLVTTARPLRGVLRVSFTSQLPLHKYRLKPHLRTHGRPPLSKKLFKQSPILDALRRYTYL